MTDTGLTNTNLTSAGLTQPDLTDPGLGQSPTTPAETGYADGGWGIERVLVWLFLLVALVAVGGFAVMYISGIASMA